MFKIKYVPTGNVFILPQKDAELLKEKNPEDYLIIEKNGRKFKDKLINKSKIPKESILDKVIDKGLA